MARIAQDGDARLPTLGNRYPRNCKLDMVCRMGTKRTQPECILDSDNKRVLLKDVQLASTAVVKKVENRAGRRHSYSM